MKINADLGENEPPARTRALLRLVDFANVACGGHAGSADVMARTVRWAQASGVRVGAHPGFPERENFGRGVAEITAADLATLLVQQVGGFVAVARSLGAEPRHVKLHGALYHEVEKSPALARAYVATVRAVFPGLGIIARAGGRVVVEARRQGLRAWEEVFAERGYRPDGSLIPRGEPGDLVTDPREVARRLPTLRGDTVCLHADTPNAVRIARALRAQFGGRCPGGG